VCDCARACALACAYLCAAGGDGRAGRVCAALWCAAAPCCSTATAAVTDRHAPHRTAPHRSALRRNATRCSTAQLVAAALSSHKPSTAPAALKAQVCLSPASDLERTHAKLRPCKARRRPIRIGSRFWSQSRLQFALGPSRDGAAQAAQGEHSRTARRGTAGVLHRTGAIRRGYPPWLVGQLARVLKARSAAHSTALSCGSAEYGDM
jgi:hypothetical protein